MKNITLQQLERDFDRILDDVHENGEHYLISTTSLDADGNFEHGGVVLMPVDDYMILKDTYDEWILEDPLNPIEEE
jgi:PHD/YefM family antitoxin component YafN of YafNO toxin-antitoxin module